MSASLLGLALSRYDEAVGSGQPDLSVQAWVGEMSVLLAHFGPAGAQGGGNSSGGNGSSSSGDGGSGSSGSSGSSGNSSGGVVRSSTPWGSMAVGSGSSSLRLVVNGTGRGGWVNDDGGGVGWIVGVGGQMMGEG